MKICYKLCEGEGMQLKDSHFSIFLSLKRNESIWCDQSLLKLTPT